MSPVSSNTSSAGTHSGISRRTLVKGAAWSVPVLMMAAPTPAFAASGCNPTFSFGGSSYKCPGIGQNSKEYYLDICVSNLSGCTTAGGASPTTMYIWGVQNKTGNDALTPASPVGNPWHIAIDLTTGQSCSGLTKFVGSGNSANWLQFFYNFSETDSTGAVWSDYITAPPDCKDGFIGNTETPCKCG